jgi:hypothetical protein
MSKKKGEGFPVEVVFNGVNESEALRTKGESLLRKLILQRPHVMWAQMVLELNHRHHHQGNLFHARIHVHCVGQDIDITRESGQNHAHEDPYVAMRDAFYAARRKLDEFGTRRSGQQARHERIRYNTNPRHNPQS